MVGCQRLIHSSLQERLCFCLSRAPLRKRRPVIVIQEAVARVRAGLHVQFFVLPRPRRSGERI